MYKKILSIVLSSLMLAQSVSAAGLSDFVNAHLKDYIVEEKFDYGKFRTEGLEVTPAEIETTLNAQVAEAGTGDWADSVSANVSDTFDFKVTLDMQKVIEELQLLYGNATGAFVASENTHLQDDFDASKVKGTFEVTVDIDDNLVDYDLSTYELVQGSNLLFVKKGIEEVDGKYVFTFNVKDGVTILSLVDGPDNLPAVLSMEGTAKTTTKKENISVTAQLTKAETVIYDGADAYGIIKFISNEDTATIRRKKTGGGKDGIDLDIQDDPTDIPDEPTAPKGYVVIGGNNVDLDVIELEEEFFIDVDSIDVPEKDGFIFDGFYLDPTFTEPATGKIQITEDTYLYPKYINVTAPEQFISDEHSLYIVGYPDGEVKPNNNITREEVVAALYRLLKPEFKATLDSTNCNFPDVQEGRWSYEAIAAFANAGFVVGNPDGNFNPASAITRAEFVTIVNKFAADLPKVSGAHFTDIAGHWAEQSIISSAIDWSWVTGYEDNTFRPNSKITRAEAVTIINKMLVRYGDVESELAAQWPDLAKTDWYYGAMIEATTTHNYTRNADGWSETWTK